jgi:catechol 2,3-dioxygenase-like lactoylglutathione lyase family enzyme
VTRDFIINKQSGNTFQEGQVERELFEGQITFIYVDDLDVSREFYEGVMGFPLALDQGTCRIVGITEVGGAYLGYCKADSKPKESQGVILTFVTPDVDSWYQYLKSKEVEILGEPKENQKFGIYHFFYTDPDGYLLEIQTFLEPDWNNPDK